MRKLILTIAIASLVIGLFLTLIRGMRRSIEASEHESWLKQLKTLDDGATDTIVNPDVRYLDELLSNPKALANLKTIRFSGGLHEPRKEWTKLRALPHLRQLSLYDTHEGTDSFLAAFEGMEPIEDVGLDLTFVTEAGLASVAKYPQLTRLYLGHFRGPISIAPLREHERLKDVHLRYLKVTEETLGVLPAVPHVDTITWEGEFTSRDRERIESLAEFTTSFVSPTVGETRATLVRRAPTAEEK